VEDGDVVDEKPFRVIDLENDYFFNFWNKLIMCMLWLVVLEQYLWSLFNKPVKGFNLFFELKPG
jgi:hypothetical protein